MSGRQRFVRSAMPIVHVTWEDSMGSSGWNNQGRWSDFVTDPQATCWSAGFLAKRDKRGLYLALSQSANGALGECLFIPRSAVRKVDVIAKLAKEGGNAAQQEGHQGHEGDEGGVRQGQG